MIEPSATPAEAGRTSRLPPQFSLRALFYLVGALSLLFGVMHWGGPMWAGAVLLMTILVAGHVAGAAIGTTLRDRQRPEIDATIPLRPRDSAKIACAPAQRMTERTGLSRLALAMTCLGAFLGGAVGGTFIAQAQWEGLTPAGFALAVFSAAVLGGLAGCLASSFLWVAGRAWREASRSEPSQKR